MRQDYVKMGLDKKKIKIIITIIKSNVNTPLIVSYYFILKVPNITSQSLWVFFITIFQVKPCMVTMCTYTNCIHLMQKDDELVNDGYFEIKLLQMNKMTESMPEVNLLLCSEQLKGKTKQNVTQQANKNKTTRATTHNQKLNMLPS